MSLKTANYWVKLPRKKAARLPLGQGYGTTYTGTKGGLDTARLVLVGYHASSQPYHPAGTYSLPVSRLPIAKQQALGLINLGCQEGGTAAVWMDFLHESPVRLYDLFLAGTFIKTQNFIGLVTCHFG